MSLEINDLNAKEVSLETSFFQVNLDQITARLVVRSLQTYV